MAQEALLTSQAVFRALKLTLSTPWGPLEGIRWNDWTICQVPERWERICARNHGNSWRTYKRAQGHRVQSEHFFDI